MKPKILAVKYFDYAILAVLGVLLIYGLIQAFVVREKKVAEIRDEIDSLVAKIRREMQEETAPPIPVPDHLKQLEARYQHMPVISAYAVNPFKPRKIVRGEDIYLAEGQTKTIRFKGIRIDKVDAANPNYFTLNGPNYDPETDTTTVEVVAKSASDSYLRLRDALDTVYAHRVVVRREPELPPPRPPLAVAVQTYPPTEEPGGYRTRPKVVIAVVPDNPETPRKDYGFTNRIQVYRKPFGAADIDYILVSDKLVPPLTAETAGELRRALRMDEYYGAERRGAEVGAGRRAYGPMGPEAAEPIPFEEWSRQQRTTPTAGREPAAQVMVYSLDQAIVEKNFAFVDDTVDEGETYVYKIVTVAYAPPAPIKECPVPYVIESPVYVPSLVEFAITGISAAGATCDVTRPHPETLQSITQRFRVSNGMLIGAPVQLREEILDGRPGPKYKMTLADFSTDCVLVTCLGGMRQIEYKIAWDRKEQKYTYRVGLRADPRAVYLTPRGFLRWKGRSEVPGMGTEERRLPAAGEMRLPPGPESPLGERELGPGAMPPPAAVPRGAVPPAGGVPRRTLPGRGMTPEERMRPGGY